LAVDYTETEEQLFSILIGKVRYYDPDMLVGYETQNSSWGYLVERGAQLGYHLLDELSRVIMTTETIKKDQWGYKKASSYRILGRHMLNVWRLMRHELTLTSYTLENVAYHLLHHRIPHYAYSILTNWYTEGPPVLKYRLFEYYMKRVQLNLEILDASQVISRMCESARVYGIDFYAVMTRGSQYNVESIMFRIAKPENFMLISPSRKQVASQRSLEILPLVMEPISQFYSSPMVVLDFQSLYPSIMIAYNYCYSTCLGRIRQPQSDSRFGVLESFELEEGLLDALKEHINVSPNGVMFVKPAIRKSLLAKMLHELLDTRAMVKRAMKDYKDDSGLLRMLDAKQLSLKLLANVTYGYTSASYSGRMPSVEIADSIVSTGRETLEKAIRLVNETEKWGARVIYGDTDSMFVYFPGKTKEEAFKLGREIADTVTKLNPAPVKLKFEKVYHPAVLLAKKRYVGFKYENETDTEPVFEAKGIETVRRDGIAATQKILESSLKILFRTQDMSELKEFLYRQWTKILSNRVPLQDFIIAKEVRMGTYSSRGGPNGAVIAQEQMNVDTRAEPQYGERVPYVVVYRGPNARLKDKVLPPEQVLADNSLRLDAEYYIRKQIIPPLARVFNLMGVDILSWYESMPRSVKVAALNLARTTENKSRGITRIDQYYASSHCIVCRQKADQSICEQCQKDPVTVMYNLYARQHATQDKYRKLLQTCENCTKIPTPVVISASLESFADVPCSSLDCPIFYQRHKAKEDVKMTLHYDTLMDNFSS
ncbi:DNA polymerase zeta, partial [Rhizopus stolonifer]